MQSHARMIDANANRAREGLRVLEDIARFVLDDGELAGACKEARHELVRALELAGWDQSRLVASRDTPGDVGKEIATDGEAHRANLPAIAHAAAGRVAEALRVLEECAKVESAEAARTIERARYSVYDVHKRVVQALGGERRQWRLCVLISESLCAHFAWDEVARRALEGGADCLQLREKSLSDRELLARAARLVAMAKDFGAGVVVNDRVDIALLAGAAGVHLGQTDLLAQQARELAGSRLLIGVSCETLVQAREAVRTGADVCGLGPMFPTTTKEKPRLAGPELVREFVSDAATSRVPHLAIGGITPANVCELVRAGCRGIAVSSVVCGAGDPAAVCRELLAQVPREPQPRDDAPKDGPVHDPHGRLGSPHRFA